MKVSTQIIEIIEALCEKFGIAIDWTAATIVPYIQELIERYSNYVIMTRWFGISFCLLVFILYTISYVIYIRSNKKNNNGCIDWDYSLAILITIAFAIIIIISLVVIPILATAIIEATYMPEVSFIKYIQGYLNNG